MIKTELDYAKGGTPGADRLEVIDVATGERLFDVVEASAVEGWYVQFVTQMGQRVRAPGGKGWLFRRINAAVKIIRNDPDPVVIAATVDAAEQKRRRRAARMAKGFVTA